MGEARWIFLALPPLPPGTRSAPARPRHRHRNKKRLLASLSSVLRKPSNSSFQGNYFKECPPMALQVMGTLNPKKFLTRVRKGYIYMGIGTGVYMRNRNRNYRNGYIICVLGMGQEEIERPIGTNHKRDLRAPVYSCAVKASKRHASFGFCFIRCF